MSATVNETATQTPETPWARKQMEKALAYHQQGKLTEAERYYRQVLRLDPSEADANNLLGVLLFQSKRAEEGLRFLATAIKLKPQEAMFFYNFAVAQRAAGNADEAIKLFNRCLEIKADHPDALNALVDLLLKRKRHAEAIGHLQKLVNADPLDLKWLKKLGEALQATKNHGEAAKVYSRCCDLEPKDATLQHQRGLCLQAANKKPEAIEAYRNSIEIKPDLAAAHNNLAILLADAGESKDAIHHYEKALESNPKLFQTRCNLGGILRKIGDLDASVQCLEEAVALRSDCAEAWCNLGNSHGDLGNPKRALECYRAALLCKPDYAQARLNRSLALLRREDFSAGWLEYEWRSKLKECPRRHISKPRWNGRIESGKKLLLHVEQGLGDTFQMARYAKKLSEQGIHTILEAQKPLQDILKANNVANSIFPMGEKPPEFDEQIPLMSLPSVLWEEFDFCYEGPYLTADQERKELWKQRLSEFNGLKIGLAWQGNPDFKQDQFRSIPLASLQPLIELPDTQYICLQKVHGLDQLEDFCLADSIKVFDDLDEDVGAFVDSAALLTELDLFVTSDSAIAHLAGALGVKTFLVLPFAADWRWLAGRADCPWYPNTCVFRQEERGVWQSPVQAMREAIQELL